MKSGEDIPRSGAQVIDGHDAVTLAEVMLGKMGSDEPGAARD